MACRPSESRKAERPPCGGWLTAATLGGAVLLPLGAYWLTLAPSITWRNGGIDSGDVATGAAVLGILHPPGYALYAVIGHGVVRALPWLEPAAALSRLSA